MTDRESSEVHDAARAMFARKRAIAGDDWDGPRPLHPIDDQAEADRLWRLLWIGLDLELDEVRQLTMKYTDQVFEQALVTTRERGDGDEDAVDVDVLKMMVAGLAADMLATGVLLEQRRRQP